jgi:EF-P beta-lysylation protein EpmB
LQTPLWRQALSEAFTNPADLLRYLELDEHTTLPAIHREFGLRVPRGFAASMAKGNPRDPLLLQVLPTPAEQQPHVGFSHNPVGDLEAQSAPGLLHKYHGRALVIASGACAVNCRYCFRRHYPYAQSVASPRLWLDIIERLKDDPSIREVILSGGDPLMVSDERLAAWLAQLAQIPHIKRLRLHSRLPVVLPERVTPELAGLLSQTTLQTLLVIHANHPNELSEPVIEALTTLRRQGVTLLNQSVLLKGVNDSAQVLESLSERLFEAGVMPYYLHLLDRVAGAAHFEVAEPQAQAIYRELLARLPGYLVPKLVREIPGEASKTPV